MGTVYAAIGFDVEALRSVVVPLVLQTVRARYERPRGMAPLRDEPRWVENRPQLRKPPVEVLSRYFSDFALVVFGNCQRLNQDLGVPDEPALLMAANRGSCLVTHCPDLATCPLHQVGRAETEFELFVAVVQGLIKQHCLYGTPTWVGRHVKWWELCDWYLEELGIEVGLDEADDAIGPYLATDLLTGLLLRLGKRGAAIGWEDDGSGLLGWLDHAETTALAAALEPYDLRPDAPTPGPEMSEYEVGIHREAMTLLREAATDLAGRNLGIALWGNL